MTTHGESVARLNRNYQSAAQAIAWVAFGIGLLVLILGWWFGVEPIRRPIPGTVEMTATTAFTLILTGASLLLALREEAKWVAVALAGLVELTAIVVLIEYSLGLEPTWFDALLGSDPTDWAHVRMSLPSGLCFLLLGIALELLVFKRLVGGRQSIGVLVVSIAFVGLVGHILGVAMLSSWNPTFKPMALSTSIVMILLGAAVIMAEPDHGWARVIASPLLGGKLFRAGFLPVVALVVLMCLVGAFLAAEFEGTRESLGHSLTQISWLIVLLAMVGLLWLAGNHNDAVDRNRRQLAIELERERRELAQSARYTRGLIEATPDAMVTISSRGVVTDANSATEAITVVPREELIGTDFSTYFTSPEDARRGYRQAFQNGMVVDYPLELVDVFGTVTPVLFNAAVYRDAAGGVAGVIATARDITERREHERGLIESARYTRSLIEASLDPLVTISAEGDITDVNAATEAITGRPREELIGTDFSNYFTSPEDARRGYTQAFREGRVVDYPLELIDTAGRVTPVRYNATVYRDEQGTIQGVFAAARDVSEQRDALERLARSERMFRLAMDGAPQGSAVVDATGGFLRVNQYLCDMVGLTAETIVERKEWELIHPDTLAEDLAARRRLQDGDQVTDIHEDRLVTSTEAVVWARHSLATIRDEKGQILFFFSQFQDITRERELREELKYRAAHDSLTGLINRAQLEEHLDSLVTGSPGPTGTSAVLFCDLDHFKDVNDNYGHEAGDEVLQITAERIRAVLRKDDIVARLGGDEFVVILPSIRTAGDARRICQKILPAVSLALHVGAGFTLTITMSIGVALAAPGVTGHGLMANADSALYAAKHAGRNCVMVYDECTHKNHVRQN